MLAYYAVCGQQSQPQTAQNAALLAQANRGVINQQIGRVAHEIGRVAMRPPLAQIETANVSGSAYPIAFSSEVDAGSREKENASKQ